MYDHKKIEQKWQKKWAESKLYAPDLEKAPKPFYNLMMFPYPSAEGLHVGNMYAFTHSDCLGRFKRLQGYDVFEPIGLDGFGIHSENYAIKINEHIREVSRRTEKHFYDQLHQIGNQYDWDRTVETYKENYYKWTQWLFLQMYKKGLAYRKKSPVNWCPSCKTVLSDEQVIAGACERCDSEVEKREMEQWFFKITNYAERLLENLKWIDWSEEVKLGQKNWIGKSEGAQIKFPLKVAGAAGSGTEKGNNEEENVKTSAAKELEVFTTRPDTIFGATYMVLAPEHKIVQELKTKIENLKEVADYIEASKKKEEKDRLDEAREKTGVELKGIKAINPLTEEEIPVWIADYVLTGYGTGAIMAVPAHDERDFEFAEKFGLEIREVVEAPAEETKKAVAAKGEKCFVGDGKNINSGFLDGLSTKEAKAKIITWLEKKRIGEKAVTYKLRDWCVSRQRYWGPPIPMIYCENCGWTPVPEKELPVKLPELEDFHPDGSGKGPLNKVKEFVNTSCPKCGGKATRETDVSDPFVDSSWYFFRYLNTEDEQNALNKERMKKWMPIDLYFGGKEHTVLHLLYARFVTMVFNDLGYIDFEEPFKKFFGHGLVIKDGAKMSKSKGNIVNPDEYIERFGADSVRMYLMFLGDARLGGDWRDEGMIGMFRFVKRVYRMYVEFGHGEAAEVKPGKPAGTFEAESKEKEFAKNRTKDYQLMLNQTIKNVTKSLERFSFNTAIARLMELVNWYYEHKEKLDTEARKEILEKLAILISPFAPHLGEEFMELLGGKESVFKSKWPTADEKLIQQSAVELVVQVNGKVRAKISVEASIDEKTATELALKEENVKKYVQDKQIKKTIFVPGKLLSFVV